MNDRSVLNEESSRTLLENSPDAMFLLNKEGVITYTSNSASKILGYAEPELTGKIIFDFMHPEDVKVVEQRFSEVLEKPGNKNSAQCRFKCKDGAWRWLNGFGKNLLENPNIKAVAVYFHDITMQKNEEERFTLAVKGINAGIWDWDVKTNKEWWSPKFYELLGYDDKEIEASLSNFEAMLHPSDKKATFDLVDLHFKDETPFLIEYRLKTKSGEYRWFLGSGHAKLDENKKPVRMVGSIIDIGEFKSAKEELQTMFKLIPGMVWYKDTKNNFVKVNQQGADAIGKSIEEVEGKSAYELFPDEAEKYYQDDLEVIRTGKPKLGINEPMLTKNGEKIWVRTNKAPYKDENGNIIGIVLLALDMTEQKKAEAEKLELLNRMRLLLDSTDEGIYGIDLNVKCIFVNKSAARLFGYEAEELIGKDMHSLMHYKRTDGSPYPITDCPVAQTFKTGEGCRVDNEVFWRKDGTAFFVEYSPYPIIDDNIIKGVVVTFSDITQRKMREEELLNLKKAVEASGEAMFMTDREGVIEYVNPEFTRVYGFSADEVVNKVTPRILKSGKLKQSDYEIFWKTLLNKQRINGEIINKTKSGKIITVEGSVSPILDNQGNISGFLAIQRDITEKKQAQIELSEKSESLEKFNKFAVGRELRMVELKSKIAELESKLDGINQKRQSRQIPKSGG